MHQPPAYLAKAELVHGQYYRGRCRNSDIARWCVQENGPGVFLYIRHKFGESFVDEIRHPEDERNFDVFYPFEAVEPQEGQTVSDSYLDRIQRV
jgi:hypothetical protein